MSATIEDLLRRAADQPEAREAALKQALALAERDGAYVELFCGLRRLSPGSPELLRALIPATLEEARTRAAPWGFRELARARAAELEDPSGAAATLQLGVQCFAERGYALGLCLMAEELADTLADVAGVERCLALALEKTKSPSEVAMVATSIHKILGQPERALALLAALPSPADAHELWSIGNALRELARPGDAHSLALAARDRLRQGPTRWDHPVQEALTLARAARCWEDERGYRQCLELAESLAPGPEELLDIAETCMDFGDNSPLARRVIAEAERRAATGRRGQPRAMADAIGLRLVPLYAWSGDREALQRLAPAGISPDQLHKVARALPGFTPDASGLLDHLRDRLDEARLRSIAAADYGSETGLHLAHLQQIVQTGRVPAVLRWNPGEVLRLCRWASGERVDHEVRAFCAAVILLCSDQDQVGNDAPILVESALVLGDPSPRLAAGLLSWRVCTAQGWQAEDQVCALWGLALLVAAADPGDPRLHTLADALEKLATIDEFGEPTVLDKCLRYTQKHRLWEDLIGRLLSPEASRPAVRRLLALR